MERYSIDESGYTGFDLLNAEQRFQGASAVCISDDDAVQLIKEHFPKLQASELKYAAASRRPGNRDRLLAFLRDVLSSRKCVTYLCDKRFLLILMYLDYATEPFYHAAGRNFYEDGQNYALASLLYYTGANLMGEEGFNRVLATFQQAIRVKSDEAVAELISAVRAADWNSLPEAFGPMKMGFLDCVNAIQNPGVSTDAAPVVLQALISRMEVMSSGPYAVEHDQSKNLLQYANLLQRMISHQEVAEFSYSELVRFSFPLKLSSVTQVNSKTSPAVQVADVLIGSIIEVAYSMCRMREPYLPPDKVLGLYQANQFIHLTPSLDFEGQKKYRQGSQVAESIDYFAKHFHS